VLDSRGWIALNWEVFEPQCPQVEQPFPLVHAVAHIRLFLSKM
jgi:hypothetical protein